MVWFINNDSDDLFNDDHTIATSINNSEEESLSNLKDLQTANHPASQDNLIRSLQDAQITIQSELEELQSQPSGAQWAAYVEDEIEEDVTSQSESDQISLPQPEDDASTADKTTERTLEYWLDWYDCINEMTIGSRKKLIAFARKHHPELDLPTIYRVNNKLTKWTGVEAQ